MALPRIRCTSLTVLAMLLWCSMATAEQSVELDFDFPGESLDDFFDVNVTLADIPATGAEDLDVWRLRNSNKHAFHNLVYAMNAPHVAMIGLRTVAGNNFDKMLFGADDTKKSPFSWTKACLSPGLLSIQYSFYFFDTNPIFTMLVCLMYISSDLSFWLVLATIALLPSSAMSSVGRYASVMTLWVLLVLLHHYVVFPLTPDPIMDAVFYSYLVLGPVFSLYRVRALYSALAMAYRETWAARRVVDPVKRAAVEAAVKSTQPLFDNTHWSELYRRSSVRLGAGSFGAVSLGKRKSDGHAVVIKTMTKSANERQEILGKLALGAMQCALGQDTLAVADAGREAIAKLVAEVLRKGDLLSSTSAETETRALRAAAALNHPYLQRLCSAHRHVDAAGVVTLSIVTSYASGVYRDLAYSLGQQQKMVLLRNIFHAIAALHAGGMVHRDLHPCNLAVDAASPTTPTILDFGLACLPGRDDAFLVTMERCRIDQFPPEFHRFRELTKQSGDMGAIATIAKTALGPPSDVFAIAIHALHLLVGKNIIEYIMVHRLFTSKQRAPVPVEVVAEKVKELKANSAAQKQALAKTIASLTVEDVDAALTVTLHLPSSAPLHSLFLGMLHPDPAVRLTMADALKHPGLQQVLPDTSAPKPRTEAERATMEVVATLQAPQAKGTIGDRQAERGPSRLTRLAQLREVVSGTAAILQAQAQGQPIKRLLSSEKVATMLMSAMDTLANSSGSFTSYRPTRRGKPEESSPRSPHLNDVHLTRTQLAELIRLTDLSAYVPDSAILFDLLDEDESGTVDGRELLAGLAYLLAPLASDATRLRLTFLAYDINRDGQLSQAELQLMLQAYGYAPHEAGGEGRVEAATSMAARVYQVLSQDSRKPISCERFLEAVDEDSMLRNLLLR